MKGKIILLTIVLMFLSIFGFLVHSSTLKKMSVLDDNMLYELLFSRKSVMNRGLYSDEDIDCIIMDLEKIEKGRLLEEDIESIQIARANPTDFSAINGLEVLKVDLVTKKDNLIKVKALVQWDISYNDNISEELIEYLIDIKEYEDRFFLLNLRPIQ